MPRHFGREEFIAELGPNELKVWEVYQDYLACIDMTIVEPAQAALVAASLCNTVVSAVGLANLPGGGKP